MRELARFISISTIVIGGLVALGLVLMGILTLDDGGWTASVLFFVWAFAVFLTAGASACVLSLLVSIDERLQKAGPAVSEQRLAHSSRSKQAAHVSSPVRSDDDFDPDAESKVNFKGTFVPKPPHWLPLLGPLFAGVAVNALPFAEFWEVVLVAVAAGLIPSVGQLVWRRLWAR